MLEGTIISSPSPISYPRKIIESASNPFPQLIQWATLQYLANSLSKAVTLSPKIKIFLSYIFRKQIKFHFLFQHAFVQVLKRYFHKITS